MTQNTYQWTIEQYHKGMSGSCFEDEAVELLKG